MESVKTVTIVSIIILVMVTFSVGYTMFTKKKLASTQNADGTTDVVTGFKGLGRKK